MQVNAVLVDIFHIPERAAPVLAQLHDIADIIRWRVNVRVDNGFIRLRYLGWIRVVCGVVYHLHGAVSHLYLVYNGGRGGDDVEVVFALDTLLDYLHVEQSEESAAEAESQRNGGLRLE